MADFGGFSSDFGPGTAPPIPPAPPPAPPDLHNLASPVSVTQYGALSSIYLNAAAGTQSAPTAVPGNFGVGQVVGEGWDGTAYSYDAALYFRATQAFTPTAHGMELLFFTTPNNATAVVNGAGVTAGGALWCGGGAPLATTATDGFFGMPTMAGPPTGAPVINYATAPTVFDTTDKQLWVWGGGAWNGLATLGQPASFGALAGSSLTVTGSAAHRLLLGQGASAVTSAPAGTLGQVLTSQGAADPTFTTAVGNTTGFLGPVPTGPASTTQTMAGMGGAPANCTFTPSRNGRVLIMFTGTIILPVNSTAGTGLILQMRYGTGAAPANGDAVIGTAAGSGTTASVGILQGASLTASFPFMLCAVLTGLVVGTTYWADIAQGQTAGGGFIAHLASVNLTYLEQ